LLAASLAMAIALLIIPFSEGALGLVLSIAIGGSVYLGFIVAMDVGGAKEVALQLQGQMLGIFRRR